jgi:hypothetical protein
MGLCHVFLPVLLAVAVAVLWDQLPALMNVAVQREQNRLQGDPEAMARGTRIVLESRTVGSILTVYGSVWLINLERGCLLAMDACDFCSAEKEQTAGRV